MAIPIPNWLEYVILGIMGIPFLVVLGYFLPLAWSKFFNYLGRNEVRQLDESRDDELT